MVAAWLGLAALMIAAVVVAIWLSPHLFS
jgi:hypothetical protein